MNSRTGLQRLLLYSHDTYGLGHLRRNVLIAEHLLEHVPGLHVVLLSGSPVATRFPLPRNLTLVALPPVVKTGVDEYAARDARIPFPVARRARAAIIADVARRFEPDVFLVDHAPQGMKGELLPAFEALRRWSPTTRIVLGLRDVVDDPAAVRLTWAEQDVARTLRDVYDRVAVYGSTDLADVRAYGVPDAVLARTSYCGYLCREPHGASSVPTEGWTPDMPFALGTAGGGGDGVDVLRATLAAAERLRLPSLLVSGPLMEADERALLEADVRASRAGYLEEFIPGLEGVMSAARVVVTMGGYNSLMEAVPSGTPTIVVPRTWPRREQAIRADLFAARGLVHVVPAGEGLEDRLTAQMAAALDEPRREPVAFDRLGLPRLRELLLSEARVAQRDRVRRTSLAVPETLAVPA
jgi:predicted glycosyltransferase